MLLLLSRWIIIVLVFAIDAVLPALIEVEEDMAVTLTCPLNVQYPTWTGPDGLANPINNEQTINEQGLTWVNGKDLKISKAMLKHDGNYTCSDGRGNSKSVEVDVQYFSTSAHFTTATVDNSTTTLTCTCYANPRCKIIPHIKSNIRNVQDNHDSVTTFKECVTDPLRKNRLKCSVISVLHVYKEDNGEEMSCKFDYKNATQSLTMYPKVKVLFPPTRVDISAKKVNSKLTLNCSTDSSNPVSSLIWKRGNSPNAFDNAEILSDYNEYIMDAEYNGRNITQAIDIDPKKIDKGEKIFCCARHETQEICESISLGSYQISRGNVCKSSVAAFFMTMILLLI